MKNFFLSAIILMATTLAASATNLVIIGRGTNADTGIMQVTYAIDGQLFRITEAELEAAGVPIMNAARVYEHMGWPSSMLPTERRTCGVTASLRDPDGGCAPDDGLAGLVTNPSDWNHVTRPIW